MSFRSQAFRVLIASPSDLPDARQAATDAINDWNALNAGAEETVLLPVRWETHAMPESGVRAQDAINHQLVAESDIVLGLFWTKIGTDTGVAISGTVEEIDQFVASGRPALLYFSNQPIAPAKIDTAQLAQLRDFKRETYEKALVWQFSTPDELRQLLARHLTQQVRILNRTRPRQRRNRLDDVLKLAELGRQLKEHKITPQELKELERELVAPPKSQRLIINDPIEPGEVGPNGYRVTYTSEGDKVEWLPDDENPGEEWPMVLRRSDSSIIRAATEYEEIIWYDRKLILQQRVATGETTIDPEIEKGMLKGMRRVERKYGGKRKIRSYYQDDFGWGMLCGKLSALRWVLGDDWDNLDT
jgi:hypothetical protein